MLAIWLSLMLAGLAGCDWSLSLLWASESVILGGTVLLGDQLSAGRFWVPSTGGQPQLWAQMET